MLHKYYVTKITNNTKCTKKSLLCRVWITVGSSLNIYYNGTYNRRDLFWSYITLPRQDLQMPMMNNVQIPTYVKPAVENTQLLSHILFLAIVQHLYYFYNLQLTKSHGIKFQS